MLERIKEDCFGTYIDDSGITWESPMDFMCIGVLHTCGCGEPEAIAKYVYDMLNMYCALDDNGNRTCEAQYEDVPTMFFLNWADHEGYTEHGTTIRFSWLTDKGKELMKDLKTVLSQQ